MVAAFLSLNLVEPGRRSRKWMQGARGIQDHATVIATRQTVPLIGVDFVAEANNAGTIVGDATAGGGLEQINDPDAVWVTRGLAKAVGDSIQQLINDHAQSYVVRGLIPNSAQIARKPS